jgi:hypothetical protein
MVNRRLGLGVDGGITVNASVEDKRRYRREYMAHYKRQSTYGIHKAEFATMIAKANGLCEICSVPFDPPTPGSGTTQNDLTVDHDHATGRVRGLLCAGCNAGLGRFKDDPDRMLRAVEYLRRTNA